ncbi:MAG: hypothetical protein JSU07_11210 [Bacteroidetes bacterium]|nr:hypothetical protein [Bacteroidota bacterium]
MKEIILIAHSFPPYPGIGGRRSAKFAKYLSRLGYTIYAISAKSNHKTISHWHEDVSNNTKIINYQFTSIYPKILTKSNLSFFEKIQYKLSLLYVKILSKGTPYDLSVFLNKKIINQTRKFIEEKKINNIIVSIAPFSTAFYVLKLKEKFKNLNVIIDMRDPWTWGSGYGFTTISKNRMEYETEMEKYVIENCNTLFVPTLEMKNNLQDKYPQKSDNVIVLSHGYDIDEMSCEHIKHNDNTITFYGSLYPSIEKNVEYFSLALKKAKLQFQLNIYSETTKYSEIFNNNNQLNQKVFYKKSLDPKKIFFEIKKSKYILILQPIYAVDFITTKIYEIIFNRVPIVLISKKGILSDFIVENKVGYFFDVTDSKDKLIDFLNGHLPYQYNSTYNIEEYSFENLTKQLEKYLS